jgi:hypothetical protein
MATANKNPYLNPLRKGAIMPGKFELKKGKSEMYSSKASMQNGIASIKKNAPEAIVEDLAL